MSLNVFVRTSLLVAVSGALSGAFASVARAEVDLIDDFGGARGFGTACLTPNDDSSSSAIDVRGAFPHGLQFFGETYEQIYVNTNGNITFGAPLSQFTPDAFPVAERPMIAPYWADVDIRPDGCYSSDDGTFPVGACRNPRTNGVWWALEPGRIIVTWHETGYYSCHTDKQMSFQLIITQAGFCGGVSDFDVEFRYNQCEWETGDASDGEGGFGGTPAQAGFDAGDEVNFVEIPGSREEGISTLLCTTSNVGTPGLWKFQVRSGAVLCPDAGEACDTGGVGVCGMGKTQCVGDGLECQAQVGPSSETCDGLDNDCNGQADEGEGLCGSGDISVCVAGRCVPFCFEGACEEGQVCSADGACVDAACVGVTCDAGLRCVRGDCVDACDGVTCPAELSCFGGRCVDLCDTVSCDEECSVCRDGACVSRCEDIGCPSGTVCAESGLCVDADCTDVTCEAGFVCSGGGCVDACAGASCPDGQQCRMGECLLPGETPGGDTDAGTGPGPGVDAGTGGGSGGLTCAGGECSSRSRGCSCEVADTSRNTTAGWLSLLGLGAIVAIRRRKRH